MAAIDTYDNLRSTLLDYVDNTDAAAQVDTFIELCHIRLNRALKLEEMSVFAYIATVPSDPWVVKPWVTTLGEYQGMRRLKITDGYTDALTYVPFTRIDSVQGANRAGRPTWYTVAGDRFRLAPVPDAVYELEAVYYQRVPTLSPSVQTNVFTEVAGDLLLYGSLLEAEPYLQDDTRVATWKAFFQSGIDDLNKDDQGQKYPDGDLAVTAV